MVEARNDIDKLMHQYCENQKLASTYKITRALTDLGNAERFSENWHETFKFDHAADSWLYWNGKKWAKDDKQVVMHAAKLTIRGIYTEAANCDDSEERVKIAKHARRSESAARINSMIKLVKADPLIAATTTDFDIDLDSLNVENGIVNLKNGNLREHDPSEMHTKIAPVNFDPDLLKKDDDGIYRYIKEASTFTSFLNDITCGRVDMIDYLQVSMGYAATGYTSEQKCLLAVGDGQNGKGVYSKTMKKVFGDYAASAPPSLITDAGKSGGATPEIARLCGIRYLEIEETDDGDRLHESRIKWLTGEDDLVARHLFEGFFEFRPRFLPVLFTNHYPRVTNGGFALWRRLAVIPCDFRAENPDKKLLSKIENEKEAVLAWVIAGAIKWYKSGLPASSTVEKATARYKTEEDRLANFLNERTISGGMTHQRELYRAYCLWCETENEKPMSSKAFNKSMIERGYNIVATRTYGNITIMGGC